MVSWSYDPDRWEDDFRHSSAGRYQESLDRAFRERLEDGVAVPDGWRRPVDPVCPKCWYTVMPDGSCAGCTERASLSGRAATTNLQARPESDEREAA